MGCLVYVSGKLGPTTMRYIRLGVILYVDTDAKETICQATCNGALNFSVRFNAWRCVQVNSIVNFYEEEFQLYL